MISHRTRSPFPFYLYLFFTALAVYAGYDFLTTTNIGLVEADRSLVHLSVIAIIVILFLYFFFSFLRRPLPSPIMLSLLSIFLWCAFVDVFQENFDWLVAVRLGLAALWILVYHFFRNYLGRLPKAIRHVAVVISLFFVFYVVAAAHTAWALAETYGRIAVVNMIYNVLVFLPWIFLVKKKWIRNLGIGVVLLAVLFSMKRGAIVVFPLMIASSLIIESIIERKPFSYIAKILFMTAVFMLGAYFANRYSEGYLTQRFAYEQLMEGSGRYEIYTRSIDNISGRSALDFAIGSGTAFAMRAYSGAAHNDWIEFLFSYGFVGAILYAILFVVLLKRLRVLIARGSRLAVGCCSAIVYLFMVGMYGMIYFSHTTLFVMAFFGAVDGISSKINKGNFSYQDCSNGGVSE